MKTSHAFRIALCAALLCGGGAPALRAADVSPEEQAQFADGLYARGLHEMAIKEYMTLIREAPGYARMDRVFYRLAESYRARGNTTAADLFYKRVMKEFPDSEYRAKAQFRRAELFVEARQYADAAALFQALLDARPGPELSAAGRYYMGYCQGHTGAWEAAEKNYRAAMTKHPDSPYVSLAALDLAARYRDTGRKDAEREQLYRAALVHPASPEVAAEARFRLGDWLFRHQRYDEAAQAYAQLQKDFPDSPRVAEAALQSAWADYHAGRFARALQATDRALAAPVDGHTPEWRYLRANTQRQLLDSKGALATYDRLLADDPSGPLAADAAYESALIAFQQHDYADALRRAGRVPAKPGNEADIAWILGESYAETGDANRAIEAYRRIVDRHADSPRAPDALYRLGRLLQERQRWAEASEAYRQLAKRYPKNAAAPKALFASGYCLAQHDEFEPAVEDWARLVRDYPKDPLVEQALFQQGLAELRLERNRPARATLEDLLHRFPKSATAPQARYWLAAIDEKAGNLPPAEKQLREALNAKPDAEWANRIRYRLATVLQKQDKTPEAADLFQGLLATPVKNELPLPLVEWLARYRLDAKQYEPAVAAARLLQARAGADESWGPVALYLEGLARKGQQRPDDAIAALTKAAAAPIRTPEQVRALRLLGDLQFGAGRLDEARQAYDRAAQAASDPEVLGEKAAAILGLGRVAETRQDWAEAARYYLSVSILFDDPAVTPEALYRAADCLGKQGKADERQKELQELRNRYPESEWAKKG